MNAKKAKQLRKITRKNLPLGLPECAYERGRGGAAHVVRQTSRGLYLALKKTFA